MASSLEDALFDPALARALPEGSRERALAAQGINRIWHVLYDPAPTLLARGGEHGRPLLNAFLPHAAAQNLSLDWTLHAHVASWLAAGAFPGVTLDEPLVFELLAACAARWARTDLSGDLGVMLASAVMAGRGLVGWKGDALDQPNRVFAVEMTGVAAPPGPAAWLRLPDRAALDAVPAAPDWVYQER